MKKLKFELSDFQHTLNDQSVVRIAQAKFDEWYRENIESAPTFYSYNGNDDWFVLSWQDAQVKFKARLVDIQEIKKECTKHIAKFDRQQNTYFCENCGAELVADWKVKS